MAAILLRVLGRISGRGERGHDDGGGHDVQRGKRDLGSDIVAGDAGAPLTASTNGHGEIDISVVDRFGSVGLQRTFAASRASSAATLPRGFLGRHCRFERSGS
jgi:hypothetical protein